MEEFQPPPPNVDALPTSDFTADETSKRMDYEAYPVRKPEEDLNDFKIQIRASTLRRCRFKLAQLSHSAFPWYEVLLGISTLSGGAFLGSLTSDNLPAKGFLAIFFNTILPIITVASFVAYVLLRHSTLKDSSEIGKEVLADLPNPEKTR